MACRAWRLRFEILLKSTIGIQRNSLFSLLPQSCTSRISRLVFVKNHHKPGNKSLGLSLCSETWAALGMTRTDPCNYFSSTSSSTCSTFSDSIAATPEEDADVLAFDLGLTTDAVGLGFGLLAYFLQPSPRHAQSRLEIKQAWSNMVCTRQAKKKKTQTRCVVELWFKNAWLLINVIPLFNTLSQLGYFLTISPTTTPLRFFDFTNRQNPVDQVRQKSRFEAI